MTGLFLFAAVLCTVLAFNNTLEGAFKWPLVLMLWFFALVANPLQLIGALVG